MMKIQFSTLLESVEFPVNSSSLGILGTANAWLVVEVFPDQPGESRNGDYRKGFTQLGPLHLPQFVTVPLQTFHPFLPHHHHQNDYPYTDDWVRRPVMQELGDQETSVEEPGLDCLSPPLELSMFL
jgi:hypothetical protein